MKTKSIWKINAIATAILVGSSLPVIAQAAETTATLEEVVVVGSRGAPRSVGDSPVPVDVISADELGKAGSNDLMMQLQGAVPSLNVHLQPISDAASMIRPANLRGLSSDSTLIMVNGKRRHRASVIAFQGGGVNDGSQGPDISVIPSIALKSVEVLRDGAAAQYGSDAVAGVINFVLNDSAEGGTIKVKKGEFSEGDGATTVVMGNFGMPLTDAGFMNVSFQMKENDATSRSVQRPDAQGLIDAGNTSVAVPAQIWGAPIIDDDVTFFFNSGLDLGNGSEAYMFGNYSERDIDGGFYFRNPDGRGGVFTKGDGTRLIADVTGDMSGNCPTALDPSDYAGRDAVIADPNCYILNQAAPGGYTPRFIGNITDSSFTMGRSGEIADGMMAGTAYDVSGSVGRNEATFGLNNTFNPSMGPDSPRNFETGSYIQLAKTFNVDLSKEYGSTSVAYGYEWRETTFSVISGEEASWKAGPYAVQGFNVGSHGFAGFSPDSAGAFSRRNYAVYGDVSNQVSEDLLVQGALRYENYSSGLDTTNYKLAFNYQLTDDVALRGSHSTGFRAPTQGQANVVNTQTTLVDGQLTQAQTLPGFKLGADQLQPEESTSFAMGIVATLGDVELTADWFNIEVDDRIALTSNAAPTAAQRAAMTAAGIPNAELIGEVNYFTNDFNTETSGLDIVATYSTNLMGGSTDLSAAYNYTDTEVSDQGNVTSDSKVKRLEEGLPNHRATFTMDQQWENVSAFVRANYYGEYYAVHADWFGTNADSAMTVDVEVTYDINESFNISVGAQNIFDQEAEKIDGSTGAVGEGVPGNVLGAIYYETSPMGIEGSFWYLSAGYNF
jgi:iron complex outermembrane receptor protein